LITFLPDGKRIKSEPGKSIYEISLRSEVELSSLCGGVGTCGKCKVIIRKGKELLSDPTYEEKRFLTALDLKLGYRLACQAKVLIKGPIVVEVPLLSKGGRYRLQVEGIETPIRLYPSMRKVVLKIAPPTLEEPRSDLDSLFKSLTRLGIRAKDVELTCLRSLAVRLRENDWNVAVMVRDGIIISVTDPRSRMLGFAVDLGSTKLAGYLIDLETGKTLGKTSRPNPQTAYGEDIMTRITQIVKDEKNLQVLRALLLKSINEMIRETCKNAGLNNSEVYEVVAVGNTFMHHSFLGINPSYLALAPYPPVVRRGVTYDAKEVGLKIAEGGKVHLLPNIAGFVGADCVAAILATRLYELKRPGLLIDIGTNTEIVLNDGKGLYAVSTASGPAFEGAHIQHGMRAMVGTIEKVAIDDSCNIFYETIDRKAPIGLCGSGVLDAIAEMVKVGILDRSGRFNTSICPHRIRMIGGVKEFMLVSSEKTDIGKDITISQKDVREIQKAKAAIATGIKLLLRKAGIGSAELEAVYIAGAFGTYIDASSAIRIGMIPTIPLSMIHQVGNAAGTGARMCLISKKMKKIAEEISNKVNYVELASEPEFQKSFIDSLSLKEFSVE
jgi:uncharacterized 2Fe-2S/4Fe-4S cluster protein (DUF4445 family)